jgi:predicted RNase H-like HicB family nuclease
MLKIEVEREEDGRWIAEAAALPGAIVCADTEAEARRRVVALSLRVIADRIDHDEPLPEEAEKLFVA